MSYHKPLVLSSDEEEPGQPSALSIKQTKQQQSQVKLPRASPPKPVSSKPTKPRPTIRKPPTQFFSDPNLQEKLQESTNKDNKQNIKDSQPSKQKKLEIGSSASQQQVKKKLKVDNNNDNSGGGLKIRIKGTAAKKEKEKGKGKGQSGVSQSKGKKKDESSSSESLVDIIDGRIKKKGTRKLAASTSRRTIQAPTSSEDEDSDERRKKKSKPKQKVAVGGAKYSTQPLASAPKKITQKKSSIKKKEEDAKGKGKKSVRLQSEPEVDSDDDDKEIDQLDSSSLSSSDSNAKSVGVTVNAKAKSSLLNYSKPKIKAFLSPSLPKGTKPPTPSSSKPHTLSTGYNQLPSFARRVVRTPSPQYNGTLSSPNASDDSLDVPPYPPGFTTYLNLTTEEKTQWLESTEKALSSDTKLHEKRPIRVEELEKKRLKEEVKLEELERARQKRKEEYEKKKREDKELLQKRMMDRAMGGPGLGGNFNSSGHTLGGLSHEGEGGGAAAGPSFSYASTSSNAVAGSSTSWTCRHCTFINHNKLGYCKVCDNKQ